MVNSTRVAAMNSTSYWQRGRRRLARSPRGRHNRFPCIPLLRVCPGLLLFFSCHGLAATKQWVAHSTDSGNWSEAGNWQPAGAPQNGDDLLFEPSNEEPSPRLDMHNDLVDLRVRKLEFCTHGWSLDGNELTLTDRVGRICGSASSFVFECNLRLGNSTIIDMYYGLVLLKGRIDLNGHNLSLVTADTIRASGQITGTGNVSAIIDSNTGGLIVFEGTNENTFSGKLTVSKSALVTGEILFDKQGGAVVNDALLIQNGAVCKLARSHQIGDTAAVCVTGGSKFLLEGKTETIGSLCLTNNGGDAEATLVDTGGSVLSVQGDIIAVNDATAVIPTIRGLLGLPGAKGAAGESKNALGITTNTARSKELVRLPK